MRTSRRLSCALACLAAIFAVAFATSAMAATFTPTPAAGAIVAASPSPISVAVADTVSLQGSATFTVDGVSKPATVAYAVITPGYWGYDEDLEYDYWVPPVYDYKHATVTCSPGVLSDGLHSATLTMSAGSSPKVLTWSFTVAEKPTLGAVTPLAGSTTPMTLPSITVKASDNSGIVSYSATVDGVATPATLAAGTLTVVPSASLANPASHTVSVTATDAAGNVATKSWSFTVNGPVTTWSGQVPAKSAVLSAAPRVIQVDARSTSVLLSASRKMSLDGVAVATSWLNPYPSDLTRATILAYPALMAADGTHTVSAYVGNAAGGNSTESWSYSVRVRPTLGTPMPTAGSMVTTTSPVILIPAADNTAISMVSATVNGAAAPASFDIVTGKVRVTLLAPLPDDAVSTVTVSAFDTLGLRADTTWSFAVEARPVMAGDANVCDACHPGIGSDPDMSPMCADCHNEHQGTPYSYHAKAEVSACKPCHVSAILIEHNRPGITCDTCHDSTDAKVKAAIASGDSQCQSCHSNADHAALHVVTVPTECTGSGCHSGTSLTNVHSGTCDGCHKSVDGAVIDAIAGHDKSCTACHDPHPDAAEAHASNVTSATFTILGTAGGTHNCSECHVTDLRDLHTAGCSTCHPTRYSAVTPWDKTCSSSSCHGAGSTNPQHASLDSAHSIGAQTCTATGCHAGAGNAAAVHSKEGCVVCHGAGKTPSTDCTTCHDANNPHAALAPIHRSADGYDAIGATHGDSVDMACSECHTLNLMALHANNCALCHADTARSSVKYAIANHSTGCLTCHPLGQHYGDVSAHDGISYGDCGPCHGNGCTVCHSADNYAPSTSVNALSSYVGTASVTFTAIDNRGVQATYYRLDSSEATAVSGALLVPAPASGSQSHSLEYWSVDTGGNQETHKWATFTSAADTVAPTTLANTKSLYWQDAVIVLTASDNATNFGVRKTYYRFDNGPVQEGTTATLPLVGLETHTLYYWSVDYAGNVEGEHSATFSFSVGDKIAPTTTSSFNPAAGAVVNANKAVTLSPVDNSGGSGVAATYYKVDSAAFTTGTSFTVAGEGLHTFSWYSVDEASNTETTHVSNQFRIDSIAPVTICDGLSTGTYYGPQTYTLSATDTNGSGVATTKWQLDSTSGSWTTGTSVAVPAPASGTAPHTIYWYSTDAAGNVEAVKSVTVQITSAYTMGSVIPAGGAPVSFTVPAGATALTVDLYGGQGSPAGVGQLGGKGGYLKATLAVTPGQVLTIKVGKAANLLVGGWGGGSGGNGTSVSAGGGSTSIALGTSVLAEAGGGGGAGMGAGGDGGAWSASATGGNAAGGTGNWCGGGGGWTAGATGKYGGIGGTSRTASGSYTVCTTGGNTTSGDGWMTMTWSAGYTLTYTAGTGGTISGSSPQSVASGGSGTAVTAVANTGYHFVSWSDGVASATRTDSNVVANKSVTANFAVNTYTLTYVAGSGGTISGTNPQTVDYNTSGAAVTAVANTGYHFVSWSDGVASATRTDSNVVANKSVTASFAINTYTLTYAAGANGTINGSSPQTVNYNASGSAITAVANTGYHFVNWSDGVATATRTDANVAADKSVTANFAINSYTLTYVAGTGGTISGTSPQTVNYNTSGAPVTAVANDGYQFANWSDGVATATRTDSAVVADKSVIANFTLVVADLTAPMTTSSFNPAANAIFAASQPVTLSATDNTPGSGVATTYYKVDSGAYAAGTSFTVTDGLHTFSYYSVDNAGNTETAHTSNQFRVDTVAPVTTSNAASGGSYYGDQTFTLTAADTNGSGVATTKWQLDSTSGAWTTGTSVAVPAPASGTVAHTIYWYSTDAAGNAETVKSVSFQVAYAYIKGSVISATGAPMAFTVPAGVTALTVDLYGGQGSPAGVGQLGGKGGYLKAALAVTPGQVLTIKVGKAANLLVGGWGGGSGGNGTSVSAGGGSTSIALGTSVLAEAGGGGGAGMGAGGDGGAWSASATGGNAAGGTGNWCGGGGGWTSGATGKYGGIGGTSRTASGSYTICTAGGNTTSGDGWMSMTW